MMEKEHKMDLKASSSLEESASVCVDQEKQSADSLSAGQSEKKSILVLLGKAGQRVSESLLSKKAMSENQNIDVVIAPESVPKEAYRLFSGDALKEKVCVAKERSSRLFSMGIGGSGNCFKRWFTQKFVRLLRDALIEHIGSLISTGRWDSEDSKSLFSCRRFMDHSFDSVDPTAPRKPGRPVIDRLCSLVEDAKIWPLVRQVYRIIFHEAISRARNLLQYLICFLCSLFRIQGTEDPYGRVSHFHRLLKGHFARAVMPGVRALQKGVKWFREWGRAAIRTAKERWEEAKHQAWERLEELIYGQLRLMLCPATL